MIANLYFLDLLGVFSFAFFGAYVGVSKKLDLFGILVCAALTGLGGGTIREVMLGEIPIYLTDYNYFLAVVLGMIVSLVLYKNFHRLEKYFLVIDAIGLSTFAFIGAQRADLLQLSAIAIVFFAVITAVGGGIMRDIAIREIPYIFQKDFYATPTIILGILYAFFKDAMQDAVAAYGLILVVFVLRLLAIRFRFVLWSRKG